MTHTVASDYVVATYLIHGNTSDIRKRAESIAVGLTVGSWTDLPALRQEEMRPRLGIVVGTDELEPSATGEPRHTISIGYPTVNFTEDVPALLTTIFGKLSMDGRIRLIDLELPPSFAGRFPGPAFGISGIREQLHIHGRPLLMSIFKSCLGFRSDQLAALFTDQALGGVDLVKDDEIFFDESAAPLVERVKACRDAARRVEEETGHRTLYAANLTGPVTKLIEKAKRAVEAGADCFLLNVFAYGFDVLQRLVEDPDVRVPIMAHPAVSGAMYASPDYGIAPHVLLGTLTRLCGADFVLYPSPYGSVAMPRTDTMEIAHRLRLPAQHENASWPVPSAGIHPGLVPALYHDLGNDQVINAGGGIHGHPQGSTAGARAFRSAIDAAVSGASLEEAAAGSPELYAALERWGMRA